MGQRILVVPPQSYAVELVYIRDYLAKKSLLPDVVVAPTEVLLEVGRRIFPLGTKFVQKYDANDEATLVIKVTEGYVKSIEKTSDNKSIYVRIKGIKGDKSNFIQWSVERDEVIRYVRQAAQGLSLNKVLGGLPPAEQKFLRFLIGEALPPKDIREVMALILPVTEETFKFNDVIDIKKAYWAALKGWLLGASATVELIFDTVKLVLTPAEKEGGVQVNEKIEAYTQESSSKQVVKQETKGNENTPQAEEDPIDAILDQI